jgi:hypothetical protein
VASPPFQRAKTNVPPWRRWPGRVIGERRDRARAILLTLSVWTSPRIAEAFSVSEDTVRLWRSDFSRGGTDGLKASVAPGRSPVESERPCAWSHRYWKNQWPTARTGRSPACVPRLGSMARPGHRPWHPRIACMAPSGNELTRSMGLSWEAPPEAQKAPLETAFRRYTVSSYVANFGSYNGRRFQVSPARDPRWRGGGAESTATYRWLVDRTRLHHAPLLGRMAGGGCADR